MTTTMRMGSRPIRALLALALGAVLFVLLDNDAGDSFPLDERRRQLRSAGASGSDSDEPSSRDNDGIARRENCQIVYALGVEGAGQRKIAPLLKKLVERRTDAARYHPARDPRVQKAVFGHKARRKAVDDPELVKELLRSICPNDGAPHVLVLSTSFPSKGAARGFYRVDRQTEWADMAISDVAKSETARNHPVNLREFYEAYSPHADVRFVVLSTPLMRAVSEHPNLDGGPHQHAVVLSGYLQLLREFLDWLDGTAGGNAWTMLCMEELSEEFAHGDVAQLVSSHRNVAKSLSHFLGWPADRCSDCFPEFEGPAAGNSTGKAQREDARLPRELINMKRELLKEIWPPPHPQRRHPTRWLKRQCEL
ncbi:hypothetical protein ACHAWF_001673 [Thalassiosira exigua]